VADRGGDFLPALDGGRSDLKAAVALAFQDLLEDVVAERDLSRASVDSSAAAKKSRTLSPGRSCPATSSRHTPIHPTSSSSVTTVRADLANTSENMLKRQNNWLW